MSLEPCPACGHRGLAWNARCGSWLCHMTTPRCTFSESEREHTARLRVAEPTETLVPDETLYLRCPTCQGSLEVPGSIMNGFACACTGTKTPGFVPCPSRGVGGGPLTTREYSMLQTDHDRLLVALWDVASVDESSEAAYLAASHVHGRQTSVYIARRNLGLPLTDVNEMALPDHEGYKAERDARAAAGEPDPDGPPADLAAVVAELRAENAALRERAAAPALPGRTFLTFADLSVGDSFIMPTFDVAYWERRGVWEPNLWVKIDPVRRTNPADPVLEASDVMTGVRTDVAPDTRVVRVKVERPA